MSSFFFSGVGSLMCVFVLRLICACALDFADVDLLELFFSNVDVLKLLFPDVDF